jgi:hypothetical protein
MGFPTHRFIKCNAVCDLQLDAVCSELEKSLSQNDELTDTKATLVCSAVLKQTFLIFALDAGKRVG